LLKGSFSLSTVASCMLRIGDWIEVKFRCSLLVSLLSTINGREKDTFVLLVSSVE